MFKTRRGMALFLVLASTALVLAFVGFFVTINQQNLQGYRVQLSQTRALQAAQSGAAYLRYCIERNREFGRDTFQSTDIPPAARGLDIRLVPNTHIVEGRILDDNGQATEETFSAVVFNNALSASQSVPVTLTHRSFDGSSITVDLPKDGIVFRVQGRTGSFQKTLELSYVGGPLYDSAATGLDAVDLTDNDEVLIGSRDPMRNWLRSNKDISFSDFITGTRKVHFESYDNTGKPITARSMVWSKKDVRVGGAALGSTVDDPDGSKLAEAEKRAGTTITPNSNLNRQIYELKMGDLVTPGETNTVGLPGGNFTFDTRIFKAEHSYEIEVPNGGLDPGTHTEVRDITVEVAVPYLVWTDQKNPKGASASWYEAAYAAPLFSPGVPQDAKNVKLKAVRDMTMGGEDLGTTLPGAPVANKETIRVPADASPLGFSFRDYQFKVDKDKALKVDGDFFIGSPPKGSNQTQRPAIVFQSSPDTKTPPFIYTETGSITIQGRLIGRGGMAAAKDLSVMAGSSNLSAAATDEVVLYAGNNMDLVGDDQSAINLRGLVYANNHLQFRSLGGGRLTAVNVEGAVVARNQKLDLSAAQKLNLIYNPIYLTEYTKGLRHNLKQIKLTHWRVI